MRDIIDIVERSKPNEKDLTHLEKIRLEALTYSRKVLIDEVNLKNFDFLLWWLFLD